MIDILRCKRSCKTLFMIFVVCLLATGCSTFQQTVRTLDYRELHDTLDKTYITTVSSGVWQPFQAELIDDNYFYLPDGKTMALIGFRGIVAAPKLEAYLNGILQKLLKNSPVSKVKARVLLIGDDAFGSIQATPDGYIIVPLRLIKETESEDEIAWILGHELSHLILSHHDSDWVGRYHESLNATFGSMLLITNKYVEVAQKFGGNKNESMINDLTKAYHTSVLVHEISEGSIFPAWQREQEDEADLLGMDLVVKAGYSIDEGDTILAKLGQWAKNSEAQRKALLDSYQEEYQLLLTDFKSTQNSDESETAEDIMSKGLDSAMSLIKITIANINFKLNQTHKDYELRQGNLLKYTDKFYGNIEIDADFDQWAKHMKKWQTRNLLSAYEKAWLAEQSFNKDDIPLALTQIRQALQSDSRLTLHSYPRWVFSSIRNEQGELGLANKNLEFALRGQNPSAKIYRLAIMSDLGNKKNTSAKKLLDRVWLEFNKPPMFYPFQIKLSKLVNSEEQAKKFLSECKQRGMEEKLKKKCQLEYDKKI